MKIVGSRMLARTLGLGLAAALLSSCGNNDSGTAQVRVVNASQDSAYASLDFISDGVDIIPAIGANSVSGYVGVSSGTHTTSFNVVATTGSTAVQSQDRTVAGATSYTVVDYGFSGALKTFQIADNVLAPSVNFADLRIINTATDAGAVDVYVVAPGSALTNVTPQFTNVAGDNLSGFLTVPSGDYQIVITGTGNVNDVRLVIPTVTLTSQQVVNLLVTPTTSGVLVNGLVLVQGGAATNFPNLLTRYRLVASMSDNSSVDATVGTVDLSGGPLRSGFVNATYTTVPVPAGTTPATADLPISLKINGIPTAAAITTLAATAGQDVSLLVTGTADQPVITALVDDNRLPTVLGDYKLRVVNAISGTVSGVPVDVSLALNFTPLDNDVPPLAQSAYSLEPATSANEIDVNSLVDGTTIYSKSNITLQTAGVYTVFVLGSASAPNGTLIKDR